MRWILFTLSLLLAGGAWCQKITPARMATFAEKPKKGDPIVYGNFVQRLGFSSGGFNQRIIVYSHERKEYFSFVVKPSMKSSRENWFCVHLPEGKYSIEYYHWTQSKWYGGRIHGEPIFKDRDGTSEEFYRQLQEGTVKESDLARFTFTVHPDELTYLGKWNFNSPLVSFDTSKLQTDLKIRNKFKKMDFPNAKISIPAANGD